MVKYIVDSSAFVHAQHHYPPENFASLWDKFHEMNQEGRLIILTSVRDELKKGNDYLKTTFLRDKVFTDDETEEFIRKLYGEVISCLPPENQQYGDWTRKADPYLLAYSLCLMDMDEEIIVIHEEKERGKKLQIPRMCNILGIPHGQTQKIIVKEGFQFRIG